MALAYHFLDPRQDFMEFTISAGSIYLPCLFVSVTVRWLARSREIWEDELVRHDPVLIFETIASLSHVKGRIGHCPLHLDPSVLATSMTFFFFLLPLFSRFWLVTACG
ncbi:hypothetical protein V8C42DRAFT_266976 [Trichoderma barbatum]